ncbi:MAG: tetratricopeptide repeat protein [Archangiaceae bacterium]|nr:tetratricopeptide repeat protein [Archangiaceae bacterium]
MSTTYAEVDALFASNPAAAEQKAQGLVKRDPHDVQAWLLLGAARLKQGRFAPASEAFAAAVKGDPSNLAAKVLYATALEAGGDFFRALAAWQVVVKAEPTARHAQEKVVKLADLTGVTEIALSARRELVRLQPGSPETVADLAVYLSRARQHAEAVKLFERADTLEPGFLEAHPVEASAYRVSKAAARA